MKLSIRCAASLLVFACGASVSLGQNIGPSTLGAPHLLPSIPGVSTTSILTVGDNIGGYRLVGIPDGMGALDNGDGTFDLMVNHELGATSGIVRAHGNAGAFVSRWNISTNPLNTVVNAGRDHNQTNTSINLWNGSGYTAGTTAYARLCSADLAAPSAYKFGSLGTDTRLFMNGEETGAEGRAFAHIVSGANDGISYQLPRLGRFSWENSVASPFAQEKTIVIGTDDSSPGEVYMYVGNKTDSGNEIERAGLTNGNLFGLRVTGLPTESRNAPASGRFDFANHGDVSNTTGAGLQQLDDAAGVTKFLRPEDGHWDPRPGFENNFYFVTTDRYDTTGTGGTTVGRSRLYRMTFDDITNPTAGGSITELISTEDGPQMMDNMTVDKFGRIIIQEDIGGQNALGKIWLYDIASAGLVEVAEYNPALFAPGAPGLLTTDEESSGVIDMSDIMGDGWYMINSQAHFNITGELVQGGQLLTMYIDPRIVPAPGAFALVGFGALAAGRRRRA